MFKNSLKNKIIIITLLILTFVGMLSVNTRINAAGSTTFDPDGGGSHYGNVKYNVGDTFTITFGALSMNDNVFCVQHGQAFAPKTGIEYKVTSCYEITGTDILKDGVSIANASSNKKLLDYAQGIAYILSLPNTWGEDKDQQTGSNEGVAQHVLWHYLYNIKASDGSNYANKIGMYEGKYDVKVNLTSEEQGYYNNAVSIFNGNRNKDYYAKYYMLEENKTNISQQELIILETTNETVTDNKDISITINKVDSENPLTKLNATFEVTFKQGSKKIDTKTLKTTGGTDSTTVTIGDTSKDVEVTIKETQTPTGYTGLSKDIKLTFEYKNHKWNLKDEDFDSSLVSVSGTNDITLNVENELNKKFSLNLEKLSSVSSKSVDGTTFKISISNANTGSIEGASITTNSILGAFDYLLDATAEGNLAETLSVTNGKIILNDIEVVNINDEVVITIEEEKPIDGFAKIESPIVIKIKWDSFTKKFKITSTEYAGMEEVEKIKMNNDTVEVSVKNYALINIKGQVWLDGQTGLKTSSGFDGIKQDGENCIEGIKVNLCLGDAVIDTKNTNENGEYNFIDIKYQDGLYVEFEYDGVNYIVTKKVESAGNITSDVTESSRETFNKKFAIITSDEAYDNELNKTRLDYNYNEKLNKSTLITTDENGDIKETFRIYATENIGDYSNTDVVINCGLVKREFDMDLTTNLDFVEVKINGKTTDYKYSTDENGNATLENRDGGETTKATYNQYLYESDYNYNLDDYFNNTDKFELKEDEKSDLKEDLSGITDVEELKVFVTYKINVINQTNKNAYIYQITNYYSDDFEGIEECYYMDGNNKKTIDNKNVSPAVSEKTGYSKVSINLYNDNKVTDVQTFYIKLKLNNGKLDSNNNLQVGNIAEISAYGTDEGYIDINSKPGNMINPENGEIRYEDDTDKAGSLNIIWTNKERTLTGVVWEDSDKDGRYNPETENIINDVTVQLIELREIKVGENKYQLEYIWQETTTGNDTLDRINLEGNSFEEGVSNGVTKGSGEFKFTGFIPGNYIIRYKYGTDGGSYDGNAYKSTYDTTGQNRYKGDIELNVNDSNRYSDAYDNEARRLGEMSIFAGETINKDSTSNLAEHWMCADTNKFEAQIANKNNKVNGGVQEVYVDDTTNEYDEIYNLSEIDFGLMKRPETEISLEKHLTALSIDVAGEGKILDAKFDLEGYLKNPDAKLEEYLKGNADNLTQIYSTRNERGFWKVETDVNELMNGAELSAEYTYVVSNNTSQADYLTEQLVNAYEKLTSGEPITFKFEDGTEKFYVGENSYSQLLKDLEDATKLLTRKKGHVNGYYLGTFYYTGNEENQAEMPKLAPVTVRIDKIEELLNNKFNFDERINYSSYGDNENYFSAYKDRSYEDSSLIEKAHDEYYEYYKDGDERHKIDLNQYKVVQSKTGKTFLEPNEKDYNRRIVLTKTLNTNNINEMLFDSHIAEILSYSVASGRRSTSSTPGNLTYSYSADTDMTLENCYYVESTGKTYKPHEDKYICLEANETKTEAELISAGARKLNETDEFWGETIIITAPTGEDGISTTLWIILGAICALIIAGGIFGIKKFVLKH